MNVLSLCDGISCGMVALERAGIKVNRYVAYEIDEYAIKVSKKNYPQIEHCGDVVKADFKKYKGFDLIIAGTPCQDLCQMGSRKGLSGDRSKIFFEFLRALKEVNPKYFLLENNASMGKGNENLISSFLNLKPVFIDSADFSAQKRKRFYWTNIPILNWQSKNIVLKDIAQPIEEKVDFIITEKVNKYSSEQYKGRKIQKTVMSKIKTLEQKSNCLGTKCGDYSNNTGLILKHEDGEFYLITPIEAERLQTLPDNYTACIPDKKRFFTIGNGWTVDVIAHILKSLKE